MRHEVQKQIDEIDRALFVIGLRGDPHMVVGKEELEASLKKAESCMRLVIETLSRNDITMKEMHIRSKEGVEVQDTSPLEESYNDDISL